MEITEIQDLNSHGRNSSYSEINLPKILLNFLTILKIQLSKGKYKKVLEEINAKENLYLDLPNGWKMKEMKIRAMLKIVRKKMNKLETMHLNTLEQKMRSRSIKDWLSKIDFELQIFLKDSLLNQITNEEKELQTELMTQLTLEEIYLWAEYSKNERNFRDCVAYLGLAERIICSFIPYSKDPRTVNIAQKCYLFISSMLISDSDYQTALNYQVSCLNLCFRELFFRVDVLNGIDYENLSEQKRYYFSKIFVNILISFYQRGVCQENLGNMVKAIESYRQSRFYAVKFLKIDFPLLTDFILCMEKRANSYHSIINNIKNKWRDDIQGEENNVTRGKDTKRKNGNVDNKHKEKELDDNLHLTKSLNMVELELDPLKEKDEKIKFILSTVNLIDLLLSNNFKDILGDMKDLNISKMDVNTLDIIQNRINEIRNEKNRINNNKTNNCTPNMSFRKNNNFDKSRINHVRNFSSTCNMSYANDKTSNTSKPKLKIRKLSANFNNYNSFQNQQHILKNNNPPNYEKVNDYVHDKFIFSQNFQKKINFLQEYENKELNFQKKLLALKHQEKIIFNDRNNTFKKDCELIFQRAVSSRVPPNRNNNIKNKLSLSKLEEERKIESREKLENCVIKSLNSGRFDEYKKNAIKNLKNIHIKHSSTATKILVNEKSKLCDNKSVDIHNIKQFCKISNEIELLEKSERSNNIYLHIPTAIPDLSRTFRNKKKSFLQPKNMDHFVKRITSTSNK